MLEDYYEYIMECENNLCAWEKNRWCKIAIREYDVTVEWFLRWINRYCTTDACEAGLGLTITKSGCRKKGQSHHFTMSDQLKTSIRGGPL